MLVKLARLTCPYCGNEFDHFFEIEKCGEFDYSEFVYCDNEDTPGCGKKFVVAPVIEIKVTTFTIQETPQ